MGSAVARNHRPPSCTSSGGSSGPTSRQRVQRARVRAERRAQQLLEPAGRSRRRPAGRTRGRRPVAVGGRGRRGQGHKARRGWRRRSPATVGRPPAPPPRPGGCAAATAPSPPLRPARPAWSGSRPRRPPAPASGPASGRRRPTCAARGDGRDVAGCAHLMRRQTSKPSISGRFTSRMMRSGCFRRPAQGAVAAGGRLARASKPAWRRAIEQGQSGWPGRRPRKGWMRVALQTWARPLPRVLGPRRGSRRGIHGVSRGSRGAGRGGDEREAGRMGVPPPVGT